MPDGSLQLKICNNLNEYFHTSQKHETVALIFYAQAFALFCYSACSHSTVKITRFGAEDEL